MRIFQGKKSLKNIKNMLTFKFYFVILDDIGCERKSCKYSGLIV